MKNKISSRISLNQHDKDTKKFIAQEKIVSKYFYNHTSTMLMAAIKTGILRANICRFISKWRKQDKIHLLKYDKCKISKRNGVGFYTSNEKLFPIVSQLKLEI